MAWGREKGSTVNSFGWYTYRLVKLVQEGRERYPQVQAKLRAENKRLKAEQLDQMVRNQVFMDMVPTLMDYVWKYNQRDIAATLKGAAWKLLHDRNAKGYHRRQAKALVILGNSFLKIVQNEKLLLNILRIV